MEGLWAAIARALALDVVVVDLGRNYNPRPSAMRRGGFERKRPAQPLDDGAGQEDAEAHAAARRLGGEERLTHAIEHLGGHSRAAITHFDRHPRLLDARADDHRLARRR